MSVHPGGCMQQYSLIALAFSVACGGSNIDEATFSGHEALTGTVHKFKAK